MLKVQRGNLNEEQELIILYNRLKTKNSPALLCHSKTKLLLDYDIPDVSKYLQFSKSTVAEQKKRYEQLLKRLSDKNKLKSSFDALKSLTVKPLIQKEIEKSFFEKTYWLSMLKKIGGNLVFSNALV